MPHDGAVGNAIFSRDGHSIATTSSVEPGRHGLVKLFGRKDNTVWLIAKIPQDEPVHNIAFSLDGRRILTAGSTTVHLLDGTSGRHLGATKHNGDYATVIFFSPNGNRFITTSFKDSAILWNPSSGRQLVKFPGHSVIKSVTFSPDGSSFVTVNGKTSILLDSASGRQLATLQHNGMVNSAAFSPDGRRIVIASNDKTARLWDTASGRHLATLQHNGFVNSATYSPDGLNLMTTTRFGDVEIWNTAFFELTHQKLIDTVCRDILNVDINTPPRKTDLSRLTDEELQMAAVINPNTERDVCRPPTRWQRFASMFGIGG